MGAAESGVTLEGRPTLGRVRRSVQDGLRSAWCQEHDNERANTPSGHPHSKLSGPGQGHGHRTTDGNTGGEGRRSRRTSCCSAALAVRAMLGARALNSV